MLPGLECTRCLHISSTSGNHWTWLLHPCPQTFLGQEWYPCLDFLCSYLSPRAAQGNVPATAGCVCSTSSTNRNSPGVACSFPLALIQLFCHHFVCSCSRHTYPNHTYYWPRQNVTCLSKVRFHLFFQTFLNETLKGYLQVAATFCNWIPSTSLQLWKIATSWLQKHNLVTSLACLI